MLHPETKEGPKTPIQSQKKTQNLQEDKKSSKISQNRENGTKQITKQTMNNNTTPLINWNKRVKETCETETENNMKTVNRMEPTENQPKTISCNTIYKPQTHETKRLSQTERNSWNKPKSNRVNQPKNQPLDGLWGTGGWLLSRWRLQSWQHGDSFCFEASLAHAEAWLLCFLFVLLLSVCLAVFFPEKFNFFVFGNQKTLFFFLFWEVWLVFSDWVLLSSCFDGNLGFLLPVWEWVVGEEEQ